MKLGNANDQNASLENIYERLDFADEEVKRIVDYLRKDTAEIYAQAKEDREQLNGFYDDVSKAVEYLGRVIERKLPKNYEFLIDPGAERHTVSYEFREAESSDDACSEAEPHKADYHLHSDVVSLNQFLVPALDALQRVPGVNWIHEGKNFPRNGKDRRERAYAYLKRQYEEKTGRAISVTSDWDTSERKGDFFLFVRRVAKDIDEPWSSGFGEFCYKQYLKG